MNQPPARVILVTNPKAGTYLLSEIVRRLGFEQTYLHLAMNRVIAYDPARMQEGRSTPTRFEINCPLHESVRLVRHGQFAASHLACNTESVSALAGALVVFATREIRSSIVSLMRFHSATGRASVPNDLADAAADIKQATVAYMRASAVKRLDVVRRQLGWLELDDVHVVRYEHMIAGDAASVAALRAFLQPAPPAAKHEPDEQIIRHALTTDTLTRSSTATELEEYWSDEAEDFFQSLGGPELNERLGYSESTTTAPWALHASS